MESEGESEEFQPDLPSRHQYLGNLQELRGRVVIDENESITIPLLDTRYFSNLVLLPNQILPLTIYNIREKSLIMQAIGRNKIIGLVHTEITPENRARPVAYGITAEIYEYNDVENGALSVKAKGMQRFKVQKIFREITGSFQATVQILPEVVLNSPLGCAELRKIPIQTEEDKKNSYSTFNEISPKTKYKKFKEKSAISTNWPLWVYELYDTKCLSERLTTVIHSIYDFSNKTPINAFQIPKTPIELSHWAAINLPIQDSDRLELLSLHTANQRLRYLLSVITNDFKVKMLVCNNCEENVSNMKDIFSLSAEGPQGTYVNPSGFVHEMFTIRDATCLITYDDLTSEHSWFPGYSFIIVYCKRCQNHIGWKFVADNLRLKPNHFYGISRRSVKVKHMESEEDTVHCH